jgi:hypothetical protein
MLMTGALLGISAASQAQTPNVITLDLVGGTLPDRVAPGDSYTLTLFGRSGTDANGDPTVVTTMQTLFRFDPAFLSVSFTPNAPFPLVTTARNRLVTTNVTSGEYQGPNVMLQNTDGLEPPGRVLDANTMFGTFTLTILDTAPLGEMTDLGLSNALITDFTFGSNRQSKMNSVPEVGTIFEGDGNLRPGAFRVTVVPGPSSLAIFALGGLAPAMALLRRRRAAK